VCGDFVKKKSNYHHGELRELLMSLAVQDIAAGGVEKLSIRALARRAGVSPTAPFRHFRDKQALLASLAIEGFRELARRIETQVTRQQSLKERFIHLGEAYVGFATDFPVHYQLMFGAVLGDFQKTQELQQASSFAYSKLDDLLLQIVAAEGLDFDVKSLGALVWSTVHGMASLLLNIPSREPGTEEGPREAVAKLSEQVPELLSVLYEGVKAPKRTIG
jgi:AcrR family transcriptional regulator